MQKMSKNSLRWQEETAAPDRVYGVRDIAMIPIRLLRDPAYFGYLAAILLMGEAVLNCLIIHRVPYTEIDWVAYMQQSQGFLDGERDYQKLRGNTGPLVYPAGFLYIYSALYTLTDQGIRIRLAQYLFSAIYLATQAVVFTVYSHSKKIPPYVIIFLCLSKRLHSLFVLRCFNDPIAMLFLYGCILAMIRRQWTLSSILYSLALSVKMNVLLFFPGFGILLWQALDAWQTMAQLGLILAVQVVLAYPFLTTYPESYVHRAFEFGRVFDYRWTVNWRMIPEKTFVSTWFAHQLLLCHVIALLVLVTFLWCRDKGGVVQVFLRGFRNTTSAHTSLTADDIIHTMFSSNLLGILFARSLHYQFYSWYFHALPYLVWRCIFVSPRQAQLRFLIRVLLLATIESCWLTFPSTEKSSWTLLACHSVIVIGLLRRESGENYTMPPSLRALV